jgi:hypothetical protein
MVSGITPCARECKWIVYFGETPYLPLTTLPQDAAHLRGGSRMEIVRVDRLDHLGLIASVIND